MKTRREIIEETKEYYLNHPRAITADKTCKYLDKETGNRCAIGRYSISEQLDSCNMLAIATFLGSNQESNPDPYLTEEVRGHTLFFWQDLQLFHDMEEHWIPSDDELTNSLTDAGQKYYEYLLDQHGE